MAVSVYKGDRSDDELDTACEEFTLRVHRHKRDIALQLRPPPALLFLGYRAVPNVGAHLLEEEALFSRADTRADAQSAGVGGRPWHESATRSR